MRTTRDMDKGEGRHQIVICCSAREETEELRLRVREEKIIRVLTLFFDFFGIFLLFLFSLVFCCCLIVCFCLCLGGGQTCPVVEQEVSARVEG